MTYYINPITRSGGVNQIMVPPVGLGGYLEDAPFDDAQYTRVNGEWVPVDIPEVGGDTIAPSSPTSLSVTATIGIRGDSVDYALSWVAPTTNVDSSLLTDFAYYVVRWRYAGDTGPWATFVSNDPSTLLPSMVLAVNIEWAVLARDTSGNDSVWASDTIIGLTDTAPPERPSVPVLTSRLGTIKAMWDGLDYAAAAPPVDFKRLEFFTSATSGGPWVFAGSVAGAGAIIITDAPVGATRYITSVSVDTSGNTSLRSVEVNITVVGVTGPDIVAGSVTTNSLAAGAVTAEKIAADTITATQIAANAITATEISANAITAAKLDANAINGKTITGGTINGTTINGVNIVSSSNITTDYLNAAVVISSLSVYQHDQRIHDVQQGTSYVAQIAAGGSSGQIAIWFPYAFAGIPTVTLTTGSSRLTTSVASVETGKFYCVINNWSPAASPAASTAVYWIAAY